MAQNRSKFIFADASSIAYSKQYIYESSSTATEAIPGCG
jgi:hypothetical protein